MLDGEGEGGGVGGRVGEHCAAHDIWRDGRVGSWMVRVRGGGSVGGLVNIVQPMIFGGTGGWGVGW